MAALLLRALDAIPPAGPTLDVARVYITFDFATNDALELGGRDRFNAAVLSSTGGRLDVVSIFRYCRLCRDIVLRGHLKVRMN
jgi:hypothetical protein